MDNLVRGFLQLWATLLFLAMTVSGLFLIRFAAGATAMNFQSIVLGCLGLMLCCLAAMLLFLATLER